MQYGSDSYGSKFSAKGRAGESGVVTSASAISRRRFLGGFAGAAALGGLGGEEVSRRAGALEGQSATKTALPAGAAVRVKPVLAYQIEARREKTSWRSYGGIQSMRDVEEEAGTIGRELKDLAKRAEFPIDVLPLALVDSDAKAEQAAKADCDVLLIYGAGGSQVYRLAACGKPVIMFLRHRSERHYLWYEITHWRLLRKNGDVFEEPNMDVDDVAVDDYGEVLWRLRALYGLKNARGTKVLAIGGLAAYSEPGQRLGPEHAKKVWGYGIEIISEADFAKRLAGARADRDIVREAERQTDELLSQPGITLATDRRFVVNSFLALRVCKDLMGECGASNFGFAGCMGRRVIEMLDTPPCLVLSLANDEGYTAYCHTDLTHTMPGVLLRWIAGRPTFVCNTHFPHGGV
ncbi:MAG: hypothetical protein JSU94_04375, partial [Phycisphaerales bacterium]